MWHMSFCFEVVITLTTKEYAKLLGEFVRFGCFTFGGGWSIIAQMQQLYVEKRQVITSQELLDLTSVAKSLPGVMIANVAMLYGYRVGGLLGGLVCVFGMCTPPMVVLIVISFFYQAFRTNYWVMAAMEGMQAAVVPIILGAAVGLAKGSVQYPPCYAIIAVCLALYLFTSLNPIVLVLIGMVSGLIVGAAYAGKEARSHGVA